MSIIVEFDGLGINHIFLCIILMKKIHIKRKKGNPNAPLLSSWVGRLVLGHPMQLIGRTVLGGSDVTDRARHFTATHFRGIQKELNLIHLVRCMYHQMMSALSSADSVYTPDGSTT